MALNVLKDLGHFAPTTNVGNREVKGYVYDDDLGYAVKAYYTSDYLREISKACSEVADWLDTRAEDRRVKTK
jgi:hypothetical protein